jgi:tryptophan synthase alpha chain
MSRIRAAFANGPAFIGFVTGGDPNLAASEEYIHAMIEAGADLIEIGIPFSDPLAEGPVIQAANLRALAADTTVDTLFGLVCSLRHRGVEVPLVFLTYLNPVLHYGYERFFARCEDVGMDGIIIPDLPYDEKDEVAAIAAAHKVDVISLIAPTSKARVEHIARDATGFIYLVSSLGVTGVRGTIATDLAPLIARVREVTDVPVAVGFGVHTPEQATEFGRLADGVIVGSAIVKLIAAGHEHRGEHDGKGEGDYGAEGDYVAEGEAEGGYGAEGEGEGDYGAEGDYVAEGGYGAEGKSKGVSAYQGARADEDGHGPGRKHTAEKLADYVRSMKQALGAGYEPGQTRKTR